VRLLDDAQRRRQASRRQPAKEDGMITLCIRYTLDAARLADFEAYARSLAVPIERCGGKVVGYYAPTKFAGPTNIGLALIDFASLAAYERYRETLATDPGNIEALRRAEASGCILVEDRSFVQRVS
jgi:NIPSNAP